MLNLSDRLHTENAHVRRLAICTVAAVSKARAYVLKLAQAILSASIRTWFTLTTFGLLTKTPYYAQTERRYRAKKSNIKGK